MNKNIKRNILFEKSPLRIKLIKSNKQAWYSNLIGQIFDVKCVEITFEGYSDFCYYIDEEQLSKYIGSSILSEDCKIISGPTNK